MQTRDQRYALQVYQHVQAIKKEHPEHYKKYGAMSHKLPILIHTAGLAQALAYVESRKEEIYRHFLRDLSQTVGMEATLCERSRTLGLAAYMHLTQQTLAALLWYKRFAQSILGVDASEDIDREEV